MVLAPSAPFHEFYAISNQGRPVVSQYFELHVKFWSKLVRSICTKGTSLMAAHVSEFAMHQRSMISYSQRYSTPLKTTNLVTRFMTHFWRLITESSTFEKFQKWDSPVFSGLCSYFDATDFPRLKWCFWTMNKQSFSCYHDTVVFAF